MGNRPQKYYFDSTLMYQNFKMLSVTFDLMTYDGYLIHNGQQFTQGQTESPKGITVFKLQG